MLRPYCLLIAFGVAGCGVDEAGLLGGADAAAHASDARVSDASADHRAHDAAPGNDVSSGKPETGSHVDAHVLDATPRDASDAAHTEASGPDSGDHDAGHPEAGHPDAGHPDAGHDAGREDASDASEKDAHTHDAGVDTGAVFAQACSELGLPVGTQEETLYIGHNPAMPWTALCVTTSINSSLTYLPLPAGNQSTYPLGGCATASVNGGTGVVSTYSRVLINPTTLMVDTSDSSGAISTGGTYELSGNGSFKHTYSVMLFASARSCTLGTTEGTASINLTGTHFVVASTQVFTPQGYESMGQGTTIGSETTLDVKGNSGGISSCSNVNDYYTDVGGSCLQLTYVAP